MTTRQTLVLIFGIVFLLIGLLGLVQNPVLGIFEVDSAHNIIHIVSGIAGLIMSSKEKTARQYAWGMGIIYGAVTIIGALWPDKEVLGFITMNMADHYLHLILTLGLIAIAWLPVNQASQNTATSGNTILK